MATMRSGAARRRARKQHQECADICGRIAIATPTAAYAKSRHCKAAHHNMVQPHVRQMADGTTQEVQGHMRITYGFDPLVATAQGAMSDKLASTKRGKGVRARRTERHRNNYERLTHTAPDAQATGSRTRSRVTPESDQWRNIVNKR